MDNIALDNLLGVYRRPIRKRLGFVHKNQLEFYGHEDPEQSCEQFRKRYRFHEQSVKALSNMLADEIGPKSLANNAVTTEQRLCCALRFYAMGTYQEEVGDGEGVSQSTMHRIIASVSDVLAAKANDVIQI